MSRPFTDYDAGRVERTNSRLTTPPPITGLANPLDFLKPPKKEGEDQSPRPHLGPIERAPEPPAFLSNRTVCVFETEDVRKRDWVFSPPRFGGVDRSLDCQGPITTDA